MNSRLLLLSIMLVSSASSRSDLAVAGDLVPYTLDLQGTAGPRIPITACLISTPAGTVTGLTYVGSGTGHGTHIGSSTWTSIECGDPVTGLFQDGLLVITAANGDTLNVEFSGTFTTTTWPFPAAEFDVIAGGTGRFSDAVGGGTSQLKLFVTFDEQGNPISPWAVTLSGAGRISY